MPPTKSPLQAIRKQVAARQRMTAGTLAGSAFSRLTKANEEVRFGKRARDAGEEEDDPVFCKPVRKKTKKARSNKTPKLKDSKPPSEPVVENWRPAGGEILLRQGHADGAAIQPTSTLGIARISTWRLGQFTRSLRALVEQYGLIVDVTAEELIHGGESVTDVFVRFRSELVAEIVKEKIDGEMLEGRKLQVDFV